jgi:hypothetical protein
VRRAFVRGIWGDIGVDGPRDGKLHRDIERVKASPEEPEFVTYVFGTDNFNYLRNLGFECKLIHHKPHIWDMEKQLYRHKLDILEAALKDHDQIVYLDWDCIAIRRIPDVFWKVMGYGSPLQANLFQYRTKKCLWRDKDWRKVCNGGFIYVRYPELAKVFIHNYNKLWDWVKEQEEKRAERGLKLRFREEALIFDDEPAISKCVDQMMGGEWLGSDAYWQSGFEPEYCNLRKKSAFTKDQLDKKKICFMHML